MLKKFYGDVLPESGHFCVALLPEGRHLWVKDHDALVAVTEKYEGREGVYFATAAFKSPANRKQDNVLALKALRLDIDAGAKKHAKDPDGTYPDQRAAIAAYVDFAKRSGIAPSYIISSGEGLHIYYCLDEAITGAEFQPLAASLGRLAAELSLRVDSSVTVDTARILRPIGGLHGNGSRVSVLRATGASYSVDALRAKLPDVAPAVTRKYDTSINDDLGLDVQGPPSSALKIAENCGALREVAEAGGDVPEPHWRAMLGLVKRTVEGVDIAQQWSSGYAGYDPDEVRRKFDNWATGPTTCAEFAKHSAACDTCKFQGKVKSPINLGLMTAPEIEQLPEEVKQEVAPPVAAPAPTGDPWDGAIPAGFEVIRPKSGGLTLVYALQAEKETETGEKVPVVVHVPFTKDIFWFGHWAEADNSDDTAQVTLHLWTGTHVKNYLMDQSVVASQSKLLEYLSGKAIHSTPHKRAAQAMQDYAKAQLQRIKESNKQPKVADHLGLRILHDGSLVAVQGDKVIYPDGTVRKAMLAPALCGVAAQFHVPVPDDEAAAWGPEIWDSYILPRAQKHLAFLQKYYLRPGMERFQLAIMLGMASPLMPFVNGSFYSGSLLPRNSALSVSLFSRESARGKTTAVAASTMAYGKGSELIQDAGKMGATDNGRVARLSLLGTLPNIMDEMGGASASSVATMVSAVANGAGRVRATREGGMTESSPWALINLVTTNTSQRDMIASIQDTSGAIQYRLLEINCDDMPEYDQALRDSFTEDWAEVNRDCPGALGAFIHREISAMGVAKIAKLVTDCCAKASSLVGADQSARFQYRGLGAMLALNLILAKLKMAPFPLAPMVEQFKLAHDAGKEFVIENTMPTDGLELLSRALQDLAPHTVITEGESHLGRYSVKFDEPLNPRMPEVIKARHIKSQGCTWVSVLALREWAAEKGVSERDMVRAAKKAGVLVPFVRGVTGVSYSADYVVLTKGMRVDMALRAKVYRFNVRGLYGIGADIDAQTGAAAAESPPAEETAAA